MSARNEKVEEAVRLALERVDAFISGESIVLPTAEYRRACESLLDRQSASVKTATLFLVFYWLCEPKWNRRSVPTGTRGQYGDKLLCEELTNRNVTNADSEWTEPAAMALKLEPYGRDIAVVDVTDVLNFLAAELTPTELRAAVNKAYEFLTDRKLCGREDVKAAYRDVVRSWLDEVTDGSKPKITGGPAST